MRPILALCLLAAPLLLPTPAFACGGMFCSAVQPVDQAAERILFTVDPVAEKVTTEVQISYSGDAPDFAWVVPVPAEPELFVSNDASFTRLANATIPTYSLARDVEGGAVQLGCATDNNLQAVRSDSAGGFAEDGSGVSVVSSSAVGPYDTVTLQARTSDELVAWLEEQGYNLPDTLSEALAPYVAEDQYFVALKLASDADTGDLAPLGMTYSATAASIPIQLTQIAAVPDLPIEVFVLGPSRAVPDNYLHMRINTAAIDWYTGGTNYRAVVAKAADEAGGQAFATDFSGDLDSLGVSVWTEGTLDIPTLEATIDPIAWLDSVIYSGIAPSTQLNSVLTTYVPAPEGMDDATFLSCPECYANSSDYPDFDPVAATSGLVGGVVNPLRHQQDRLDASAHVTRLFTTMDPSEMTLDPFFVFNAEIDQSVSNIHNATSIETESIFGVTTSRRLVLADGREYKLPDAEDTGSLSDVADPAALVIEDLSATGDGDVIFDGRDDAQAKAESFSSGCSDSGALLVPGLTLLAAVWRRRRSG